MDKQLFAFISFIFLTVLVAAISYYKTHKANDHTASGYFMAGNGLTAWFIAGSMLLTNLSAEQLVGLNGESFAKNMSAMAWESTAAIATIALAMFFLPRYLKGGFSTLPQFLEERFDVGTRRLVSAIFIISYTMVANPVALYLGAIAIDEVFGIHTILGVSRDVSIWILVWITGGIGALYAVLGGLRAVAVSDTINGIVLFFAALLVPILGFALLGNGSVMQGMVYITAHAPEKLNAIGGSGSSVPFGTIFTGMLLANLFFWCTNQMLIQRTLAAKNLAEGQKGVLFTGLVKIMVPFFMMIPGIIAYHLFKLDKPDLAYPHLLREVMPWWLIGFFIAAFFGAVISHFNSIVNSTATLVAYDFYQAIFPEADDKKMVYFGKMVGVITSLVSLFIAPLLLYAPDGIYMLIRRFNGFFNIPIIAIVLVGFFSTRATALPVKISFIAHIIAYTFLTFFFDIQKEWGLHFIHLMGIMFAVEVSFIMICSYFFPRKTPYVPVWKNGHDMPGWKHAKSMSTFLVALLVTIYISFSPLGLAVKNGPAPYYIHLITATWLLAFIVMVIFEKKNKKENSM